MTTALLIAAVMFGYAVAIVALIQLFRVLTAPDDDMIREVDEEAETLDVWGRL